ncbi:hypothetical protein NDU88_004292 [Pleurodeles waltl]|uniref:Uncharacterized protein n=1 Tax=Pleurodeles waltl TaxID=8319 RepID=A0AAV7NNX6_PLEWA|nr:hypothetical protein NDU88_004292 [Pleurodeles waltl]
MGCPSFTCVPAGQGLLKLQAGGRMGHPQYLRRGEALLLDRGASLTGTRGHGFSSRRRPLWRLCSSLALRGEEASPALTGVSGGSPLTGACCSDGRGATSAPPTLSPSAQGLHKSLFRTGRGARGSVADPHGPPKFLHCARRAGALQAPGGRRGKGDKRGGTQAPAAPDIRGLARRSVCVVERDSPVCQAAASPRTTGLHSAAALSVH